MQDLPTEKPPNRATTISCVLFMAPQAIRHRTPQKPNPVYGWLSKNYGPFLGTLDIRCRIIIGTQKGTILLTTIYITPIPLRNPYKATARLGRHGIVWWWTPGLRHYVLRARATSLDVL